VGWLSRDDLSTRRVAAGPLVPAPAAQCQGKFHYEYAIFPHAGDWRSVYQAAYQYVSPLLAARADTHEGLNLREMNITRDDLSRVKPLPWPRGGKNPETASFIAADSPELVLSSLHRTKDGEGWIARFYNISSQEITACIQTCLVLDQAWLVNLNEEWQGKIDLLSERAFRVPVRGRQVVTFELRPKLDGAGCPLWFQE
jgi:alpha-mannosidase